MSNPFDQFVPMEPAATPRKDGRALRYNAPELDAYADEIEVKYGLPTGLVRALKNAGERSDSWQVSPAGARGVMQFMPQNIRQYGVTDPTDPYQMIDAAGRYLRDTSKQYGGHVGAMIADYNGGPRQAKRVLAGQRPMAAETDAYLDRVTRYMGGGSGGGGGTGGMPAAAAPSGNPFDQFDSAPAPSAPAALGGANPFDAFDAPDFSNLQTTSGSTEGAQDAPDYSSAFAEDPGNLGKIGLRALVGRIPELTANLAELPGNFVGAIGDALPGGSMTGTMMRRGFDEVGGLVRALGYENDMQATGYGAPSVTGGEVLDAINPTADVPLSERASRVANFIPETLVGSAPDMLAAVGALPAYIGARTNEVAENRAANDQRANPSLTDLAVAAPAATAESLLERLTTMRLLPGGGGAAVRPGVAAAAGRVASETGLQGASGAVEEAIPYLAETLGTQAPATGRGLAEALATGLVAEGALGGGAQGIKEAAGAIPSRPPAAPASLADLAAPPPTLPAVAAEGTASPRQGDAPAAPPTPSVPAEKQEVAQRNPTAEAPTLPTEKINTAPAETPARPDMAAATQSIDDRLAALDDTAAGQIDEAEVSALNAERQELDDLLREQDRAKREGLIQSPESRLSPQERATADARRTEIAATLERHRAARTAADQAQRLRTRLENTDSDAGLFEVAREINPTLGTPQAETFRAPAVKNNSTSEIPPSPPAVPATPSVPVQAPSAPIETNAGTTQNVANVGDRSTQGGPIVGQRARSEQPSAPPAVAPETGIPISPRAESQREPAPPAAAEAPARTTSLKNAVTDAERVAEGRDPIIRAARKGNRETVDAAVNTLRKTPSIGRETAARLAEGGPVELKDEAVLLVHKVDLRKRRDAAAERAQNPNVSEEARAIARREYDDAVQQIDEVDQAASRIGTESGRLLQLRKRMIAEDYSMPALERKLRMVVNRDLKPAEQAEIKELADKVATLQRKLDAVESQQASAQVAEMLARLMKQAPGKNATLAERRAAAMESKAALSAMASTRAPQRSIPEQTDSAAFRRWFGDSKVVDANGEPLVVYHGSPDARFLKENATFMSMSDRFGSQEGVGVFFFAKDRSAAESYTDPRRAFDYQNSEPGIVPAYIKLENPLVIDAGGKDWRDAQNRGKTTDVIQKAKADGHDGVIIRSVRDNYNNTARTKATDTYAVFNSRQIKSATDNAGTFDPADPNIMRSQSAATGKPGQARAALTERLGRGVVARLERAGVLEFDDRSGGTWDGTRIGIGNVSPESALGVLLHEVSHANMLDVLGEQGYERALRDLDALEAAGDPLALKAKRRAAKSGETGQRLDDERIAYMVEEATNAAAPAPKVTEFVRSLFSAFRRWAATSPVFRALERIGVDRPTLKPADFAAFARKGLDRMVADAKNPESAGLRGKVRELENQLRTNRLTGLPNRLAFDEDAALGWPTVAFFDVDSFKKLNDQVGHDPADVVLKLIGEEVKKLGSAGIRPYHVSGDEFLFRFKSEADAKPLLDKLQESLEGVTVELETRDADNNPRFFEYQGIGISYGVGANYDQADSATKLQKQSRLESGAREEPRGDGPSRRIRESAARPGGRREGDPPAVGAQRSVPDQTQTPAFKRWFGDSKVVDANGEPMVVYHGTDQKFETFDPSRKGVTRVLFSEYETKRNGFFFATDERAAGEFGSTTMPVYLSIKNPADFTTFKANKARDAELISVGLDPSDLETESALWELFDDDRGARVVEKLKELGYDGVMFMEDGANEDMQETLSYMAFDPSQIKSATSNRGTFDPSDPSIMRSIPEGEDAAPAGADPVAFFHLARMGAFHYADGARTESEWTKRMEGDLGPAADRYRSMLADAFKASKAQADRVAKGPESVAEAVEAIGDQRRPRDVKRIVRAVVAEGMRGEEAIISATAQALDMDDADVRTLFVQSESQARTLTEAQAELKDLRKQLRDAQKPDPETRYQDTRARDFQRRIEELEARIAAGDFAKPEKIERELVERNQRLQLELERTKERFHKYALEAEFNSRTPIGKIFGNTVAGINFARAIMTSLDLSAILRQGGKISFGHPLRALKAVPGSLKAFVSEDADILARKEIQSRTNAPLYKRFGLELTSIGGDALSRTEEAYASRWVDKLPTVAGGGLIRGSGRSYTAFLNRVRADSFDAMLAALARDGSNPTKEEGKAIANYINVATGRGKVGKNEKSGEVLNTVFFAPRLVASRFQLLAGQPLYGGSNRTRKMIAMEYARFLIGVSVAIGLAMLMRDEDDETKPIELDPRSANFGKVRFGDTFLDPLAGLAQVTVFLARVASGETRTTISADDARAMAKAGTPREDRVGKLKALRDEYRLTDIAPGLGDGYQLGKTEYGGRDIPAVISSFLQSKLAPVPGAILNVSAGENMIGETVTPLSAAGELVTPMSVGNLVDVLESQGMARGTAINLLGILGMSVQYRKSDAEKAAEDENGIPGALGFGTAEDME